MLAYRTEEVKQNKRPSKFKWYRSAYYSIGFTGLILLGPKYIKPVAQTWPARTCYPGFNTKQPVEFKPVVDVAKPSKQNFKGGFWYECLINHTFAWMSHLSHVVSHWLKKLFSLGLFDVKRFENLWFSALMPIAFLSIGSWWPYIPRALFLQVFAPLPTLLCVCVCVASFSCSHQFPSTPDLHLANHHHLH